MNKKMVLIALVLSLFSLKSMATVWYVDSANVGGFQDGLSWASAFTNPQNGINAANAGDSVWIAKGTYKPAVNTSYSMKEGVKIFGGFLNTSTSFTQRNWQVNVTILKGNGSRVISNTSAVTASSLLDGFMIIGGSSISGAGMYNGNGCSPTIQNCIFKDNIAIASGFTVAGGGAMYISGSSSHPIINNCTFSRNSAQTGSFGEANGGSISIYYSSPTINNCAFDSNYTSGSSVYGNSGGAICNNGTGTPIIQNCTFSNNTTLNNGGGIYNLGSVSPEIKNCLFSNNSASKGGGIYNQVISNQAKILNCVFSGNNATNYGGGVFDSTYIYMEDCTFINNTASQGGGVYNSGTSIISRISKCILTSNSATNGGGAIYNATNSKLTLANCVINRNVYSNFGAGVYNFNSSPKIINCSVIQNISGSGGGIYNANNSSPNISNAIIWGNNTGIYNDATSTANTKYSLIQGYSANANAHLIDGNTNPLFVDTSASNYQLQSSSPCINMGNNDSIPSGITTDLAGNARIYGGTVDMGAYEYGLFPPVVNLGLDASFCAGSNITLNAQNAGATYLWNTGATLQTIPVTTSGTYYVTVTNPQGSASDTIVITVNPVPVANLGNDTAICTGAAVALTLNAGNAGSTYLWNNNSTNQTLNVNTAGTYYVTVTNAYQCSKKDTIIVTTGVTPTVNLGNDTSICAGNTLTLNAQNAGASYLWSNAATTQTIPVNTTGTYYVTVTNAAMCQKKDTINVTINTAPVVNLGNDTAFCLGNTLTLNAQNAGSSYLWSNAATSQTIGVNTTGTYYVAVTGTNLCVGRDTIQVTVNPLPVVNLGTDTGICAGSTLTLNAQNAGSAYLWNNNSVSQTQNVSTAGTYYVTVTDANLCKGTDTIQVNINPLPVVNLGNDTSFCEGNTLTLNAENAGSSYLWSNAATSQTISVNASGTYSVEVTNANQCTGTDAITVTVNPSPVVVNLGNDTAFCAGNSLTLNAQNAGSIYNWSTGATTQTIDVNAAGTYNVTVIDANNCKGSDTIQVTVNPLPVVNLGNDMTIPSGGSTTLDAGNPGATYLWSTGATTQTITVSTTGTYSVTVTNSNGCQEDDAITVTVGPVGINDVNKENYTLTVTPNPAKELVHIHISDLSLLKTKAIITDAYGRVIREVIMQDKSQQLSLSGLAQGIYILRMQNGQSVKIVKE